VQNDRLLSKPRLYRRPNSPHVELGASCKCWNRGGRCLRDGKAQDEPGLQGAFYKQFAITIASATMISAFVSLTLSPALAAILLRPHKAEPRTSGLIHRLSSPWRWFLAGFDWAFDRLSAGYAALTARLIRVSFVPLIIYAGLIYFAFDLLSRTPTGLIPTLIAAI
jgi:multidrug efflux pump subunit AcrB